MPDGRIFQVNVSSGGVPKLPVRSADVTPLGLSGDGHAHPHVHGGPQRALCLYSLERIAALQAEGHPIFPGATGENLTLSGLDWATVVPGLRLRLGAEVVIEVTQYTEPCATIAGAFAHGHIERMSPVHHPGWARVYARVLQTGRIFVGDPVARRVSPSKVVGARRWLWPDRTDDIRSYLVLYPMSAPVPRGAVLICPGGGYAGLAPHEAEPIARRVNACGLHAFVVMYRVAPHRHPAPLRDAARALRIIRRNAEAWRVRPDRIAVCGFSAGGHLAASLGVHWDRDELRGGDELDGVSARPDALILGYPVISSEAGVHRGSFRNLLGPAPAPDLRRLMSLEHQVTAETPPTFLWHTADDAVVPVENSLVFARALRDHDVPFELHVYPHGAHGLGLAGDDEHVATWMDLCCGWLRGRGWA